METTGKMLLSYTRPGQPVNSRSFTATALGDVRLGPEEVPADDPLTSVTHRREKPRYDSTTAAAAADTGIRPATPQRMRHPRRRPPGARHHHRHCDLPRRIRPAGLDFQLTMAARTRRLIVLCDGRRLARLETSGSTYRRAWQKLRPRYPTCLASYPAYLRWVMQWANSGLRERSTMHSTSTACLAVRAQSRRWPEAGSPMQVFISPDDIAAPVRVRP